MSKLQFNNLFKPHESLHEFEKCPINDYTLFFQPYGERYGVADRFMVNIPISLN